MGIRRAQSPFRFVSCMELREITGVRAHDEQRLLEKYRRLKPAQRTQARTIVGALAMSAGVAAENPGRKRRKKI